MKYVVSFLTILSLFFLSGCSNDGAKAEELFETAQLQDSLPLGSFSDTLAVG